MEGTARAGKRRDSIDGLGRGSPTLLASGPSCSLWAASAVLGLLLLLGVARLFAVMGISGSTIKILACLLKALDGLASFAVLGRRGVRIVGVDGAGTATFSRVATAATPCLGLEGVGVTEDTVRTEEDEVLAAVAGRGGVGSRFLVPWLDFDRNMGVGTIMPPTEKPMSWYGFDGS